MSSIRLSGSTSGHYDLTVPAVAGTNSIDLSNLAVKDSSGNLDITGKLGIGTTTGSESLTTTGNIRLQTNNKVRLEYLNSSGAYVTGTTGGAAVGFEYLSGGADHEIFFETHNGGVSHREVMRIDKDGYVRRPYQPCFDVASNQGVSQNNYQTFNIQYHNVGGHFSLSNNRFTAPVSGLYQFFATTIKSSSASGSVSRVYIYVNGSVANGNRHVRLSEGSNYGSNGVGSWIISMSAGDYAQVWMGSGGSGSHSSSEYTYFNGYLLQ